MIGSKKTKQTKKKKKKTIFNNLEEKMDKERNIITH